MVSEQATPITSTSVLCCLPHDLLLTSLQPLRHVADHLESADMQTPLMRGGPGTVELRRILELMAFGRASVSLVLHDSPKDQTPCQAILPKNPVMLMVQDSGSTYCWVWLLRKNRALRAASPFLPQQGLPGTGSAWRLRCPGTAWYYHHHDSTVASVHVMA